MKRALVLAIPLLSSTLAMATVGTLPPKPAASPSVTESGSGSGSRMNESVRSALYGFQSSLGELKNWQKRIFNDEIVANGQDFVREHRLIGDRVKVDLDETLIRRTLQFYAPEALGNEEPRVAARIEAAERCALCDSSVEPLKKLLQSRLEARGLRTVWFKDEEMPAAPAQGTPGGIASQLPRFGFLRALELSRGLQGSMLVRVEPLMKSGDSESAGDSELEPEEGRFVLRLGLTLGKLQSSKKVEFQRVDSIEVLARRLWTESMVELTQGRTSGTASAGAGAAAETGPGVQVEPEVLIAVSGVRDYAALSSLKFQIQQVLGGSVPVLERSLLRGKVVLALRTAQGADELRGKLSALDVGSQKLILAKESATSGSPQGVSALEGELK
jgi:hypothetical protein